MQVKFTLTFTIEGDAMPLTVEKPDLERACVETAHALLVERSLQPRTFKVVKKHYKIAVQQ